MVKTVQAWPKSGIIMPKIYYFDEPDILWSTGGRTRWMPSNILLRDRQKKDNARLQHEEEIKFAPSCCLLLTRALCQEIAFDESYFFYYDDWDFCLQARKNEYQIIFSPNSHIWHKVSRSTQNRPKVPTMVEGAWAKLRPLPSQASLHEFVGGLCSLGSVARDAKRQLQKPAYLFARYSIRATG